MCVPPPPAGLLSPIRKARMSTSRRALPAALASVIAALSFTTLAAAPGAAATVSLLPNSTFNNLTGWRADTSPTRLAIATDGRTGTAAQVTGTSTDRLVLSDSPNFNASGFAVGTKLEASAWVRVTTTTGTISLSVKEKNGDGKEVKNQVSAKASTSWKQISVPVTVTKKNAQLDFAVRIDGLPVGQRLLVDDVVLGQAETAASPPAPPVQPPPPTSSSRQLSNGCTYSTRGIPSCGAYVGGAYNSNGDPATWESWLSKQIGVRRAYFSSGQINSAVTMAKADAAKNRITWMSFKAPHSWKDMAAGKGDAWARELGQKLATIDGPVWVAIHHEPENDGGDIKDWTAMQARLAPIVRNAGSNIGFSIIVMGYHQFYGDAKFSLANMWPKNTTVDVAGFDIYDEYGMTKRGAVVTKHKQFRTNYFEKIQAWAKPKGIYWGLAETGFTEASVKNTPSIMSQTYNDMVATGGIAFAYFNTNLNATVDWRLNTTARKDAFKAMHKNSATIK